MKRLRAQGGQMILEALLLMVALFASTVLVSSQFKKNEFIKGLITAPFANLAGMLQNGVWGPVAKTNRAHPSGAGRHVSILGETVR